MHFTAALSRGPAEPFSFERVETTGPAAGEVLVRLVASGICHTDLVFKSMLPAEAGPVLLGHEGSGVVQAVGADVTGISVGDHVLLSYSWCGHCARCTGGQPTYCENFATLNPPGPRPDGTPTVTQAGATVLADFFGQSSFATHAIVPQRNVVVVGSDVDLVAAAPLGCGIQTGAGAVLNVLRPGPDSHVAIFGAGGVGLAALLAARSAGAASIVVVDLVESRRVFALELGATAVVDPAQVDLVEGVRAATDGGPTHALDTTGVPAVIAQALKSLAPLGSLVAVGLGQPEVTVDIIDMIGGGKTLRGCIEGDAVPDTFLPQLLALHRDGRFPYEQLVTRYPFDQLNEAVADMGSGATVKPVLVF